MSNLIDSQPLSSRRPGTMRSIIVAGVAALVLGALSAFVSKAAYSSPNAPVAVSGSAPVTM